MTTFKEAQVICFANNKGGVGKSSTVATIGRLWAREGHKVLLIDLDSQANLTTILDQPIPTDNDSSIRTALLDPGSSWPYKISENLSLWPSNLSLSRIDLDLAGADSREFRLLDAMQALIFDYDFILIDCPPALGLMTFNALVASDFLVLTSTADELSYSGMGMIAELAGRIRKTPRMNPKLRIIGLIITKFKLSKVSKKYLKLIHDDVGDILIQTPVRERTAFQRAISMHKDIFDYEPNCETAKDYKEVADELKKRLAKYSKDL